MKLKQSTTSTQRQISDIPREERMTAVFYEQEDGTWLTAYSPNPPTPEAVAKAQFVDKTFRWVGK